MHRKYQQLFKALGPGILFASTCIGVSHLVQSTRAGANYGFMLIGVVILVNIFKYPFFEFASRYTNATGRSIIDGYYHSSKWILGLYLAITLSSMFIVAAAVTFVTSGLLSNFFTIDFDTAQWSGILLALCILILTIGKYKILDITLKLVSIALVISVIIAVLSAMINGRSTPIDGFTAPNIFDPEGILFIIALMGWMPTAIDMSTWTSLWTEARIQQTGYHPKLNEALYDFKLGYFTSAVLAIAFLSLGAMILYGTGGSLPDNAAAFAGKLIGMFTSAIGDWSYYIILTAAFSTMFSTTITVIDGYCRATARSIKLLLQKTDDSRNIYIISSVIIAIITYLIIAQFLNNLKALVDFATALSFIIAPLAGWINYMMVFNNTIPASHRPKRWLKILAIFGLMFLSSFTIIYFYIMINGEL